MKKLLKYIVTFSLLLGVGYLSWKFFSNPMPIPLSLLDRAKPDKQDDVNAQDFPMITIGDSTLTPNDFKFEYDVHLKLPKFLYSEDGFNLPKSEEATLDAPIEEPKGSKFREHIVSSMIERKLLFLYINKKPDNFDLKDPARYTRCVEATNAAIKDSPQFFDNSANKERLKTKLCEQAIIEQYLKESVFRDISITSSEISAYYRSHEKNFKRPQTVLLKQVVVAKEDLANEIRKEIKPHNFSALAKKHSITPEAENGGLIGPFSKEQLPTLFDIVFSMNVGEISGVIKSEFGYHIIMPTERRPQQTLSLAEASPKIRAEIIRTKKLDAYQRWLNTAMNAISVNSPNTGVTQ